MNNYYLIILQIMNNNSIINKILQTLIDDIKLILTDVD